MSGYEFKVGDRVRALANIDDGEILGCLGTVDEVRTFGAARVRVKFDASFVVRRPGYIEERVERSWWVPREVLELLSSTTAPATIGEFLRYCAQLNVSPTS